MIKVGRIILFTVSLSLYTILAMAQDAKKTGVDWLTPEEMYIRYSENKKPIIVDIYTDWCHYCKVMDRTTWKNDSVTAYVSEHFYMVKIDAENKQPYQWMGTAYNYDSQYKVNMLAIKLLEGKMAYPSTLIIPAKGEPELIQGAFTAKELEMILKYYGERTNENLSPERFQKKFKGNWR